MNVRVGFIPYLNMAPFHHAFGPEPMEAQGRRFEFLTMSPHALGLEAERGAIDAGALSLVDWLRFSTRYEPIGLYGVGAQPSAQSVLLFSNRAMADLKGMCAVTDDTSTSFRLLQLLLEVRYGLSGIHYGRIASRVLFDGDADALLLIGDDALRAKKKGMKGLPFVTDLGEEWFRWQGFPFVFARWVVRGGLHQDVKDRVESAIQGSLAMDAVGRIKFAQIEGPKRQMSVAEVLHYWSGFAYRITPEHQRSIDIFSGLLEKACLVT